MDISTKHIPFLRFTDAQFPPIACESNDSSEMKGSDLRLPIEVGRHAGDDSPVSLDSRP